MVLYGTYTCHFESDRNIIESFESGHGMVWCYMVPYHMVPPRSDCASPHTRPVGDLASLGEMPSFYVCFPSYQQPFWEKDFRVPADKLNRRLRSGPTASQDRTWSDKVSHWETTATTPQTRQDNGMQIQIPVPFCPGKSSCI